MATARVIPNYDLYGDSASPAWASSFNFEWIPQRSRPYHWVIHPHRHDSFLQVLYLTRGKVEVEIDHTHSTLQAPAVMLIPAGHVHGFHFSRDIDGPVVTATQKGMESLAKVVMPELLETIRTPRLLSLQSEMRYIGQLMPLFLALEQESRTQAEGQVAAGMSLLIALMVQVGRISRLTEASDTHSHYTISRKAMQIEKFRSLIDQNFRREHAPQAYASEVGVTVGQLSRLCREVLGKSSQEVINDRLLQESQRELIYTSLPVKQLAGMLGFDDDAYFSRFFRKHMGVTPKVFRAEALRQLHGEAMQPGATSRAR